MSEPLTDRQALEQLMTRLMTGGDGFIRQTVEMWPEFAAARLTLARPDRTTAILSGTPQERVCVEIISIMSTYRAQEASGYVDTPGGLEHMGDVWKLLSKWDAMLREITLAQPDRTEQPDKPDAISLLKKRLAVSEERERDAQQQLLECAKMLRRGQLAIHRQEWEQGESAEAWDNEAGTLAASIEVSAAISQGSAPAEPQKAVYTPPVSYTDYDEEPQEQTAEGQ